MAEAGLAESWAISTAWQDYEPGSNHNPMPPVALLAGIALAVAWGWVGLAVVVLLAFDCCLRPTDFLQLRRRDIRLPSDTALETMEGFVIIQESVFAPGPKTRKRSARRQQAKIADPLLIEILERYFANFRPDDFLLAGGYRKDTAARLFRQAFDAVYQELGFSTRGADGLVPASLRAGGVTELFRRTEDFPLVRWR